jgi:F-type H+-transporting ATPase subunit delta
MKTIKQTRRDARRLFRLCIASGSLNEGHARMAAEILVQSGRRGSLPVLSRFLHLVKLEKARRTADIQSATPIPADLAATLLADLERRYGPGLSASFAQDPSLIGGMRIKVGNDVYDGSIRGALAGIENSF